MLCVTTVFALLTSADRSASSTVVVLPWPLKSIANTRYLQQRQPEGQVGALRFTAADYAEPHTRMHALPTSRAWRHTHLLLLQLLGDQGPGQARVAAAMQAEHHRACGACLVGGEGAPAEGNAPRLNRLLHTQRIKQSMTPRIVPYLPDTTCCLLSQ